MAYIFNLNIGEAEEGVDLRVEDQPSLHSQPRFQIMILFHQKMKIPKPGIFLKLKDTNIVKGSFLLLWKYKFIFLLILI